MSQVHEDDSWKHAKEPPARIEKRHLLTRAELQAKFDEDYASKRITLEDWRWKTDVLSDPKANLKALQ